jgi:hypothetical protein
MILFGRTVSLRYAVHGKKPSGNDGARIQTPTQDMRRGRRNSGHAPPNLHRDTLVRPVTGGWNRDEATPLEPPPRSMAISEAHLCGNLYHVVLVNGIKKNKDGRYVLRWHWRYNPCQSGKEWARRTYPNLLLNRTVHQRVV